MTWWLKWLGLAAGALLLDCGSDSSGNPSDTGAVTGTSSSATASTGAGPAASTTAATGTGGTGGAVTTSGGGDMTGAGGSTSGGTAGASAGGSGGAGPGAGGAGGAGGSPADGGPAGAGGKSGDAGPADAGTNGLDPEIGGAVSGVSSTRIGSSINTLAGFPTRNACATPASSGTGINAARDWIRTQYQAIAGLTVSLESFSFIVMIPMMGTCGPVTHDNVIAVKPGTHPDRVFVIGGHYDSRTVNVVDFSSPAPGANDSGSQTAAVLEIARAMAPLTFDATLVFASFAAEEQGLYGSAQLAKDYKQFTTSNAKVEAMLDLDIVGGDTAANNAASLQQFRLFSPGTPREIMTPMGVTDDESPSRNVMRYVGYWGSRYVPSMTMVPVLREDRVGRGSDHESFLNLAYPAVHFIETVESANSGMPGSHQHTGDDLPAYVTPAYAARIAQVVVAVGASLARAPMPPQMTSVTGTGMGPWTPSWSAPASGPAVDHYVVAARPSSENFHHTRVVVPASKTSQAVTASDLGITAGQVFYLSVAAVDAAGHESTFSYPEYRCSATGCAVPADALNVTAMQ
jgi:Peptidase family M28